MHGFINDTYISLSLFDNKVGDSNKDVDGDEDENESRNDNDGDADDNGDGLIIQMN